MLNIPAIVLVLPEANWFGYEPVVEQCSVSDSHQWRAEEDSTLLPVS
jgi:hypothetical protein